MVVDDEHADGRGSVGHNRVTDGPGRVTELPAGRIGRESSSAPSRDGTPWLAPRGDVRQTPATRPRLTRASPIASG
jgi:hypothetical protein